MKSKADKSHIRIYRDMLDCDAFKTLPGGATKLFLDLRVLMTSFNNGSLMVTLSVLERRGWNSRQKLTRALDVLLERGILKRTKYCAPNVRHEACRYGFTDLAIHQNAALGIAGNEPTFDYVKWTPPENSDTPNRGSYGTRFGEATVPVSGKHPHKTVPVSGKREIDACTLRANGNQAFSSKSLCYPESGKELRSISHTSTRTPLPPGIGPDGAGGPSTVVVDPVLHIRRTPKKKAPQPKDEFERARLRYERRMGQQ